MGALSGNSTLNMHQHNVLGESEGQDVPVHAMKAYRGSGGMAPLPDLGTSWVSVVSLTYRPL
jgi:hypothetical protein